MERARLQTPVRLRRFAAKLCLRLAGLLLLCGACGAALADAQARPSEYDVKAAYLLNFGKFIRGAPGAPVRHTFDICVVGADPMGKVLDSLAHGEQIDSRPVRVRRMNEAVDARSCDIAYLSTTDTARLDTELAALRNSDVLTVGEGPRFLKHGGMIQFVLVDQRVRFSVNLNAVHQTHLVLSSELLRVAFSIIGQAAGELQP